MNENLIMNMIAPYLQDGVLTYSEFESIFNMLSIKEQYKVIEILHKNHVDCVDERDNQIQSQQSMNSDSDYENEDFEILYDESLFEDDENDKKEIVEDNNSEFLKVRRKISLSNRTLIQMIQDGNAQAKQDLCIKNKGLVDKWAAIYEKMFGNKLEFEDLRQAGMLGMIKAAERFDLNMHTEFSTYAVWWIKQAITREIEDTGYTIRIPVHKMEQIYKVMRADSFYAYENNYFKRMELVSAATEMPLFLVEECLRLFYQFIRATSLDLPIGEDEDTSLGDMVPYEDEMSTEDTVAQIILKEQISEVLKTLTDREQKILRLRFGLEDGRARTLEELGKEFCVTRERIRQIEAKALRKLRHPSRCRKLRDYLD